MTEIPSYSHLGVISGLAWSADGSQLFSASYDGAIRTWREGQIGIVREPPAIADNADALTGSVSAINWSVARDALVAGEDEGVASYSDNYLRDIIGERISAVDIKCSPTGDLVALREMVPSDDKLQVGPRLRVRSLLQMSNAPILDSDLFTSDWFTYDIAWTPRGDLLAVLTGGDVTFWSAGARTFSLPKLRVRRPIANAIAWLNNDDLAVAYNDGNVRIFDGRTRSDFIRAPSREVLESHEAEVTSISVGMAGERFATADTGGCICVWNESRVLIQKHTINMPDVTTGLKLCFNPRLPILAYARGNEVGLLTIEETDQPERTVDDVAPNSQLDKILATAGLARDTALNTDEVERFWHVQLSEKITEGLPDTINLRRIARATLKLDQLICNAVRSVFVDPTREQRIALEDIEIGARVAGNSETSRRQIGHLLERIASGELACRRRSVGICAYALFWFRTPNHLQLPGDMPRLTEMINNVYDDELRQHLKDLLSIQPSNHQQFADTLEEEVLAIATALKQAEEKAGQPDQTPEPMKDSLALVMKGGGLKGLACIGALKELQQYYEFDLYVGTSAGAIIAALLGAGYTTDEMETILRDMDFRKFLSERLRIFTNIIFYGGLFRGDNLTHWVDRLLAKKLESSTRVEFGQLKNHVKIYACRRDLDALVFDSKEMPRMSVAYAVRCSVAIPIIFTPEREQGLRVFDGGMRNNYPVKKLLEDAPGIKFIGLYLGDPIYEPRNSSVLGDLLSVSFEATDTEALRTYKNETIVVDPKPVSTLDFSLSNEEKTFLLSQGRLAALRFLLRKGHVEKSDVDEAVDRAEQHRVAALAARKQRTFQRRIIRLFLLCIFLLALLWKLGAVSGLWQFVAETAGGFYASTCQTLSICSNENYRPLARTHNIRQIFYAPRLAWSLKVQK